MTTLMARLRDGDLESANRVMSPQLYREPVAELIRDASTFAVREAQGASSGLGGIPSSIAARVQPMSAEVSTGHPAALVMETGRRAGAKMPPLDVLTRYGADTFPIARAIKQRGIRGRFFMRKAAEALDRAELPRLIRVAQEKIAQRWAVQ